MFFKNWTLKEVEQKAAAIKELGLEEVYLDDPPFPWDLAQRCEEGGSHRLNIATVVYFYATSPSGIKVRWSFDIEPRSASGKGTYQIDAEGCRNVLSMLPEPCKTMFREYLSRCTEKVNEQANELTAEANREYAVVKALREI